MKISIISTVYNKEKYLSEHIDSLLNQNYKNIEFIFVNDGSTDNSLKIIKEKTTNNNKVIIINQINKGPNIARKKGFSKSTGDLIYFVDGDDKLYNEKSIDRIINIFTNNKNIDFVLGKMINSYDNTDIIDNVIYGIKTREGVYEIKYLYDKVFRFSLCNKVIKRENICEKDFIKYKNYEDCFLTYKIFNRCKRFYYDIQPLYIVNRKSDNSNRITANFKFNDIKIKYIILNKLLKSEIKFKTSLKKLYLKGYLDDLQQSLKIVKSEKREYLLLLKISVPKDYFIETNLINFRYKKIYYLRYLYNNFFFNNIISFFSNQYIKFKQIVRNILIKIVRW